jgi:hypothetical protein
MSLPAVAALIWLIAANLIGMLPSRDHHWRNAYALIAVGLPILVWLVYAKGVMWGLAFLIAAGSVLRWPLIYLMRWIRRRFA